MTCLWLNTQMFSIPSILQPENPVFTAIHFTRKGLSNLKGSVHEVPT